MKATGKYRVSMEVLREKGCPQAIGAPEEADRFIRLGVLGCGSPDLPEMPNMPDPADFSQDDVSWLSEHVRSCNICRRRAGIMFFGSYEEHLEEDRLLLGVILYPDEFIDGDGKPELPF